MLRNLIILLIVLTGSATCYAQVTISDIPHFDIAKIKKEGLTKRQTQSLPIFSLKHEKYNVLLPGVFIDGDLKDKQGKFFHSGYYSFGVGYVSPSAGATDVWGGFR
ncbi:hypothetical protein Cf24236_1059 [Citrobacter farmeri]|nr:hypothetical protein Cf24236_1059 [Citrobacter farmeri]